MLKKKDDEIDKKDIEMNLGEINESFISEETNGKFTEEFINNFGDFSNQQYLDFIPPNMDFSDMITSSSKYTQSISDANLLLNQISSKLFQSEGHYSTLLSFFDQMNTIILDQDSNISKDDITVSSACKSIVDQTIKLRDENIRIKLALREFTAAFDIYYLNETSQDTKNIPSSSIAKDDPISNYPNIIDHLFNRLDELNNKKNSINKNDQNKFNLSHTKDTINEANNDIEKSVNKDQQKLEKMTNAIQELKNKVEKMKKQKYIHDAGIKRILRQLTNDNPDLVIEDNDEKYDKIIDEIKELQKKCIKFSKVCQILQSNFVEGDNNKSEFDIAQIIKIFSDLKRENNLLKNENEKLTNLL